MSANQYAALQTPTTGESKSWESAARSTKDDAKEQAHQAKTQVKGKAAQLQEQVVQQAGKALDAAKGKAAQLAGKPELADKSADELADDASDAAAAGWEEVKRRGAKAKQTADAQIDANLTPEQRAKLGKGLKQAKQAGLRAQSQADGLVDRVLSVSPVLRPVRNIVRQYHLQLPVLVLGALLSLWLSLSLIRLATAPSAVPELDIHSREATTNWLKWHAGEYKNKALDTKADLSGRAAHYLANHNLEALQDTATNWRDIGVSKLGLREPTWTEWATAYVTGRPLTWQDRVSEVLSSAKHGLTNSPAATKAQLLAAQTALKGSLGLREPTYAERLTNWVLGRDTSLQARLQAEALRRGVTLSGKASSTIDSLKAGVESTVDSIKSKIPYTDAHDAAELAKAKAYAATHQSTLGKVASQAEYVKNRIVHGAEEAAHRADEAAKKAMDEAKLKTGL